MSKEEQECILNEDNKRYLQHLLREKAYSKHKEVADMQCSKNAASMYHGTNYTHLQGTW